MAPASPIETPGARDALEPDREEMSLSGLAMKAHELFKAFRYDECVAVLEDLRKKREGDPKVIHNIAITEYYRDGEVDPKKLLGVLSTVQGCLQAKSEELARTADEQLELSGTSSGGTTGGSLLASGTGALGNTAVVAGANGIGGGGSQVPGSGGAANSSSGASGVAGPTGTSGTYIEEYDTSIPTANKAVMLFYLQQYGQVAKILEPLSHNLEPLDEDAALRVCWLLLDTWLICRQPEKAAPLVDYAEKVLARCEGDASLSGASSQCTGVVPASSGSSGGDSLLTTSERIGVVTPASSTGPNASFPTDCELGVKSGGGMYDVGIEEDAVTSLDLHAGGGLGSQPGSVGSASCGPAALPSSGVSSGIRGTSSERDRKESVPSGIHEVNLHMYRARLLMLVRNLKATKREVKLALNLIRDHMPALVLKAQLEYCRGNFRKAIKLLTTCFCGGGSSPGDAASLLAGVAGAAHLDKGSIAMLLSNLGCVHFRLGKHSIAAVYFVKALENYMAMGADRPLCVRSFAKDKTLHVLCNMGIQQLYLGNPLVGFRCFQESVRMFYNRPLLWLRLAECCISAHAKGLLEDRKREQGGARGREEVILRIVGEERWRQVLLPTGGLGSGGGGAKAGSSDFHVAEAAGGEGEGIPEGVQGEGGRPGTGGGGVKATAAGVFPPPKWSKAPPQQGQGPEEGASGPGRNSCLWDVRQEPSLEYASLCLRNALALLDQLDSTATAAAAAVALADPDSGSVGQNATSSACIQGGQQQQQQQQGAQHQQSGGGRKSASGAGDRRAGSVAPSTEAKDGDGGAVAPSVPSAVTVIASAVAVHEDERRMECSTVQQCILANLAYVELVLDNPVASLAAAERLLRIQGCCPRYSFLGHMYAAEALCMLDRPTVAAEHLTTCMLEHTNSVDSTQGSDCGNVETEEENGQKWKTVEYGEASTDGSDITTGTGRRSTASSAAGGGIANAGDMPGALSGTTAHASLYVNLAAVYAMQGELLQAQQCALQALKVSPTNPLAILAVVYVELSRGRKQDALDMLKHCRNIKCLWGGVATDATSNAAGTMGLRPAAVQALS